MSLRQAAAAPTVRAPGNLDQRLFFAPLRTLSVRKRLVAVLGATLCILLWAWLLNGNLSLAWGLSDVPFYMHMARGRYDLVPAPFSARPLAPLLARCIASAFHAPLTTGFSVVAWFSLAGSLLITLWLVLQSHSPRWMFLAVVLVPFWPHLLGIAGLPDPLYTLLLALLLLALEHDQRYLAAGMMLPLMLTRESTWLTLACLLLVTGKRLRWGGCLVAVAAAVLGAKLVHHLAAGSLPNPEHMSGPTYMVAKVASNALRSLGFLPWSNVYPMLCTTPAWQHALHFGKVTGVGVCRWDYRVPLDAAANLLTLFGMLPLLFLAILPTRPWRRLPPSPLIRFCLLYGTLSLLLAPTLGTWYLRLFGYAWPLPLIAVPRLIGSPEAWASDRNSRLSPRTVFGVFLVLHAIVCGLGALFVFPVFVWTAIALEVTWLALYFAAQRTWNTLAPGTSELRGDVVKSG